MNTVFLTNCGTVVKSKMSSEIEYSVNGIFWQKSLRSDKNGQDDVALNSQ